MKASLTSLANNMSEPTVRVFLGFHLLQSFQLAIFRVNETSRPFAADCTIKKYSRHESHCG